MSPLPLMPLQDMGEVSNRRGTTITFMPDPEIYGPRAKLKPETVKTVFAPQILRPKKKRFGDILLRPFSSDSDVLTDSRCKIYFDKFAVFMTRILDAIDRGYATLLQKKKRLISDFISLLRLL